MILRSLLLLLCFLKTPLPLWAQEPSDSLDNERLARMVSLTEVVVRNNLDVARFIDQIRKDTSFYKAFRNVRVLGFTSWNDIRLNDRNGRMRAALRSKTRQTRAGDCRAMEVLDEVVSGDFYESGGGYRYYTAELYAGLFFTRGTVCGETNIVKGTDFRPRSQTGMARHKEQLKLLLFNPGKRIPGIPFIGDRIDIFDPERARLYDFRIDLDDYEGRSCYIFTVRARADLSAFERDAVVIDSMVTWFDASTFEVMARTYGLSYDAGVYDFNVQIEVQLTRFGDYLVPRLMRYIGNWDMVFRKRERGMFTATLFDFNE